MATEKNLPLLTPGGIYQSTRMGLVEYKRVDTFHGQTTFEFRSITYAGAPVYVLPERLDEEIKGAE